MSLSVLPDPGELDAVARSIAAHASTARARAARLTRVAGCTEWHGTAAGVFALKADDTAHALRVAAGRLEDAAVALHRHARAVEGALASVHALAVRTEHGLEDVAGGEAALLGHARSTLSGAAGLVGL